MKIVVERHQPDGTWATTDLRQIKAGEIYRYPDTPEIEHRATCDAYRRPDSGGAIGGWTTNPEKL